MHMHMHMHVRPRLPRLPPHTACPAGHAKEFLVRASYLEIYNEEIRDLLSKNPQARLELKEHPERGVYVRDLMQFVVKSVAEISSVLQVRRRSKGRWGAARSAVAAVVGAAFCQHARTAPTGDRAACALAAGGQEEPSGGRDADESGQLALTLHLHHHHRGHRALQLS
jgi:kinesin family protein 3/17